MWDLLQKCKGSQREKENAVEKIFQPDSTVKIIRVMYQIIFFLLLLGKKIYLFAIQRIFEGKVDYEVWFLILYYNPK